MLPSSPIGSQDPLKPDPDPTCHNKTGSGSLRKSGSPRHGYSTVGRDSCYLGPQSANTDPSIHSTNSFSRGIATALYTFTSLLGIGHILFWVIGARGLKISIRTDC